MDPSCKIAATKIAGMNESVLRTARGGTAVRPKTVQGWTSDSERMVFSSDTAWCLRRQPARLFEPLRGARLLFEGDADYPVERRDHP